MANELLTVKIDGTPRPQGKLQTFVRGGHSVARYPDTTNEHRAITTAVMNHAWGGREPFTGSVYLRCIFAFARPKSHYGTGRNAGSVKQSAPILHTQVPDVDKLTRLVCDALKGAGVVKDDSQVTAVYAQKVWSAEAFTRVYVHGWDGAMEAYQ